MGMVSPGSDVQNAVCERDAWRAMGHGLRRQRRAGRDALVWSMHVRERGSLIPPL